MNTPGTDSPAQLSPATVPKAFPWQQEVEIRPLVHADLPALEWEGEYAHFRRLYADAYRRARAGMALIWVAELPVTGVIGQLFVQLRSARTELADGVVRAYIHSFRLRPAYRGAGVGTRMLMVAEAELARRGFSRITLNVSRANPDARRLYERLGYRVVAAEPGRWKYLDQWGQVCRMHDPSLRMEKSLSA